MSNGEIRLLIYDRPNSYSDRWKELCIERQIDFEMVSSMERGLVNKLNESSAFLWHWGNRNPDALMFARSIIRVAEQMGVKCFPNLRTCWHYDDKVAQSFLLSAIGAPTVEWEFFSEKSRAVDWLNSTAKYPLVLKLKGGSGSRFVYKIDAKAEAVKFCKRMFDVGIDAAEPIFSDVSIKTKRIKNFADANRFIKALPRKYANWRLRKRSLKEKGYLYVQSFLPGNDYDTRITVIGERCFAFCRKVRPGDFRASGSGRIEYDREQIDQRCIQISRAVVSKLDLQTCALDFIFDAEKNPMIVEISYGFQAEAIFNCPGYYDRDHNFVEGHFWPQDLILDDLLSSLRATNNGLANTGSGFKELD